MTLNNPSWDALLRSAHDVTVTFPACSGLPMVHLEHVAPDGLSRQRLLVAVENAVRPLLPRARVEIEDLDGEPVVSVSTSTARVFGNITLSE